MRRWLPLALLAGLLVVAIVASARGGGGGRSEEARVERIASEVRCPTCRGLSAAESDAEAAKAVQAFIRDEVRAGRSDAQIKAELVRRYGTSITLRPPAEGVGGLVWAIPVVGGTAASAGLAYAFWRWRGTGARTPTADDVVIVERARRS